MEVFSNGELERWSLGVIILLRFRDGVGRINVTNRTTKRWDCRFGRPARCTWDRCVELWARVFVCLSFVGCDSSFQDVGTGYP